MPLFRKKSDAKQPSPLPLKAAINAKIQRTPSNRSAKKSPDPVNGDIGIGDSFFGTGSARKGHLPTPDESDPGDLGVSSQDPDEPLQTASRLSKTLQEIIHDRDALPHFIRFMEAQKAGQLIRFWLDAESFQASTWSRIRSHSLNKIRKSSLTPKLSERHAKPEMSSIPQGFDVIQSREATSKLDVVESSHIVGTESQTQASRDAGIEQDAVTIFTKYLAQDASDPVNVTDDLRNEAIHKICREDGEVDPCCFVSCQKFVLELMQKRYYEQFQSSEHHYRHQMEILTSGRVFLADILYNETSFFYFMEYMEQEQASYLLQFFLAAENFQQHLLAQGMGYDGMQAQADAMVLYDKYFSLQASQPLGFPDSVRFEVESNICQESGPLPDCFSKPRDIVLREIEKTYFTRYLHSEIFYKYLSELVSSVQTAQDFPLQQCRKRAVTGRSRMNNIHNSGD